MFQSSGVSFGRHGAEGSTIFIAPLLVLTHAWIRVASPPCAAIGATVPVAITAAIPRPMTSRPLRLICHRLFEGEVQLMNGAVPQRDDKLTAGVRPRLVGLPYVGVHVSARAV